MLQQELSRLLREERPRVTREVSEAAAQGDRSENAEYIYGKKRLREIDRRIEFLTKRLDELRSCGPTPRRPAASSSARGSTVEDEDGEDASYQIVGPDEFDVAARAHQHRLAARARAARPSRRRHHLGRATEGARRVHGASRFATTNRAET